MKYLQTIYKVGLNGMCTDCCECYCSAGGYHTWCLFLRQACQGLLGAHVTRPIVKGSSASSICVTDHDRGEW